MEEKKEMVEIGRITHYFPHPNAAVVKITNGELKVGDTVYIKGHSSDFEQKVTSLEVEGKSIEKAVKGDEAGLKVKERVREHDIIYKVS